MKKDAVSFGVVLSAVLGLLLGFPGLCVAELMPAQPKRAVLSTSGGVLTVAEEVAVHTENGQSTLSILLPEGGENVRLEVVGEKIVSWQQTPHVYKASSQKAQKYEMITRELARVQSALKTLEMRLAIWETDAERLALEEREKLEKRCIEQMPQLFSERLQLQKEEKRLQEELKNTQQQEQKGMRVTVALENVVEKKTLPVTYSYSFSRCGWKPHYTFAIAPEEQKDEVHVQLLADVWQSSGIDWSNTELVLMIGAAGGRVAPSLKRWNLEAIEPEPAPRTRYRNDMVQESAPMMASRVSKAVQEPRQDTSGIYARWILSSRALTDGHKKMLITERTWKAPLQWIARPNRNKGEVYLRTRYDIPTGDVWPAGPAVYIVSGQETGKGHFMSRGGTLELYFGMDPRVSFEVVEDKQKRGESGFLGRDKTWDWAWTYVLKNRHNRAITVRVERPEPMAVDEAIKVSMKNTPEAVREEKTHALIWNVPLAAGEEKKIQHAIHITCPEKLRLYPSVP